MSSSNKSYNRFQSFHLYLNRLVKYFFLLTLLSITSFSQINNLRFEHIFSDDGLSSNDVRCITQDYRGFLWIGTQNGLNRYDGMNIKIYRNVKSDSSAISSNWINTIYEDKDSNLWIGTRGGGLNLFIRETGKFINWETDNSDQNSISGNDIWCIYEDSKGNLWIGTRGAGLNLFDRKKQVFRKWLNNPLNNTISSNSITTVAEANDGNLWIGTEGGGINIFNFALNKFSAWEDVCLDKKKYPSDFINSIYNDSKGNIWIGSDNSLTKFSPLTKKYEHWFADPTNNNGLSSAFISRIFEDEKGGFWISTKDGGLNYYNPETGIFSNSKYSGVNKFSLSSDEVFTIYKDYSNVLWIGTHGGGLNKLTLKNLTFQYWSPNPISKKGLPDKEIRKLFADRNEIIWIGTNSGLSRFDKKSNTFKTYFTNSQDPNSLRSNRIRSIYRSRKGVLYIGLEKGGLAEFDKKNNMFISYLPSSGNIKDESSRNVRSISEDSEGVLWLGAYNGGLHKFNPKTKKLVRVNICMLDDLCYRNEKIQVIKNYSDEELWLGTEQGLVLFNTKTHKSKKWVSEKEDSNSLIHNAIRAIHTGEDGVLWIGTRGGLSRFDFENESFTNFTSIDGMTSDVVFDIVPVNEKDFWLITSDGISIFNSETFVFKRLSIPFNNQLDVGINSPSNKEEIILGGKNGLTIFNSDDIRYNEHIPEVVFTEFMKYNVPIEMYKDYPEANSLNLDYTENMFSISFASLDFSNPTANNYSYKLEGFNDDWINLMNTNTVAFTNLVLGEYRLLVKASNDDGIWNPQPAVLNINISPPFWKTIYFQISLALLLILLVFTAIKLKVKNVEKQNKTLDELVKVRTSELESEITERKKGEVRLKELNANKDKFFSIISHDLRSPFTAITGLSTFLLSEFNSLTNEELREYIATIDKSSKRVYGLLENLLDWSRVQTGRMIFKPEIFNMNTIVAEVIKLFEINFENKNIIVDFKNIKGSLVFADYEMVYTILRNLVSNAIKFTQVNGSVEIKLKQQPDSVLVSIIDDGIGMDEETLAKLFRIDVQYTTSGTIQEKGSGLGLILCKELVEMNKGKIWVESNKETGTTFNFILPSSF